MDQERFKKAGIDQKFKGHSTRHSASSTALRAVTSIESIRKAAGLSDKSETLNIFYNNFLCNKEFFANYIKKVYISKLNVYSRVKLIIIHGGKYFKLE